MTSGLDVEDTFKALRPRHGCEKLSRLTGLFQCRNCCRLGYSSQYEHPVERLIAKQHKLGERIFDEYEYGEGFGKKKGMHWQTFHTLYEQYQQLGEAVHSRLAAAGLP